MNDQRVNFGYILSVFFNFNYPRSLVFVFLSSYFLTGFLVFHICFFHIFLYFSVPSCDNLVTVLGYRTITYDLIKEKKKNLVWLTKFCNNLLFFFLFKKFIEFYIKNSFVNNPLQKKRNFTSITIKIFYFFKINN